MVERADIIRLLYLYDRESTRTLTTISTTRACRVLSRKIRKSSTLATSKSGDSYNNFIYTDSPRNSEVKDVIQKIHLCEWCTDLNFASPYFMRRYNFTSKVVYHRYESSWYWWKVKGLKNLEQAKTQAQGRSKQCQDEYSLTYFESYIAVIFLAFAHVVRYWNVKQKQK